MKTYQQATSELKSLEGHYTWGAEADLLFAKKRVLLIGTRFGVDVFGVKYGAFETADRGVCLVQFRYQDTGPELEPTGFNLYVNFIEDRLLTNCPNSIAKRITDERAKAFLEVNHEKIKDKQSIGEYLRSIAVDAKVDVTDE